MAWENFNLCSFIYYMNLNIKRCLLQQAKGRVLQGTISKYCKSVTVSHYQLELPFPDLSVSRFTFHEENLHRISTRLIVSKYIMSGQCLLH